MKPFNLEKFLAGEPAITTDGIWKVIDYHYFKNREGEYRLCCVLSNGREGWNMFKQFTDLGKICVGDLVHELDLKMEEKEVDLWINVYGNKFGGYDSWAYDSESVAIKHAKNNTEQFKGTYKLPIKE